MTNLQVFTSRLRTKAWRTQSARFNAARRLRRRDWFGALSIGLFSTLGVGITVYQRIYTVPAGSQLDNYLTTLGVCSGLFVVVISLIEWGLSSAVRADSLHRNAQELDSFQTKLEQVLAEVKDGRELQQLDVTAFRQEYDHIVAGCAYNHEPIDDQLFLVQQRFSSEYSELFHRPPPNLFKAACIRCLSFLSITWYFGFFWIVVLALLLVTLWGLA